MAIPLRLINFKASDEEKATWVETSQLQRKNLSEWIRDTLNAAAENPVERVIAPPPPPRKEVKAVADQLLERAAVKAGQQCDNRLPKGAWCKKCLRIHA